MREIIIHPDIIRALDFSPKETAVFEFLIENDAIFGREVSNIAKNSQVPAKAVSRILLNFEQRGLVKRTESPVENRNKHQKRC